MVHIEAIGNSLKTWLNGVPCANLIDNLTPDGFIGLQVHARPESNIEVKWQYIKIINLGTTTEWPPRQVGISQ
jgi:hypothetical protein